MSLCRTLAWIALAATAAPQSQLSEVRRLQNEGDYPRAIALLESYLREEPDDVEGGTLLAWLYTQTEKQEQAVETYRSLLSRRPDEADLHNSLGALLFKKRELVEAEARARDRRHSRPLARHGPLQPRPSAIRAGRALRRRPVFRERPHARPE